MKRWAILTVLLYALALVLLTMPVVLVAMGRWGLNHHGVGLNEAVAIFADWGYWLWLAVLIGGQSLLLLLPIHIAERRLPARRPLKTPVIVTSFFLANLLFAGIVSILCAVFTDKAFDLFDVSRWWHSGTDQTGQSANNNSGCISLLTMLMTVLIFWLVWGLVFRRATRSDAPEALLSRSTRWLLRGSILELIIAVPSHVIVRRRDDCCAPVGTFWGLATGISVMLLCFGPGVYFLFVERMNRLQPKITTTEKLRE